MAVMSFTFWFVLMIVNALSVVQRHITLIAKLLVGKLVRQQWTLEYKQQSLEHEVKMHYSDS